MKIFGSAFFVLLLFSTTGRELFSQEKDKEHFDLSGRFVTRGMSTFNENDLTNYSIMVSHLNLKMVYSPNSWLSFKMAGVGLVNYVTDNLLVIDPTTGFGPIYEANLWSPRYMSGTSEFMLSETSATFKLKRHSLEIGRFVKDTPIMNGEKWPFPNALQGLWYKMQQSNKIQLQFGLINRIASRFSGDFLWMGESIGQAGWGVGLDGNLSQYYMATSSDYLGILNFSWESKKGLKLNIWDYHLDNISNTLFLETDVLLSPEKQLSFSAQAIIQSRIGEGGNANPDLRYFTDEQSYSFGFRLKKKFEQSSLELNYNRITGNGRMLMPREWGVEPFYTLQRRTRLEGASGATSLVARYNQAIIKSYGEFNFSTSAGLHDLANPRIDYAENKYFQPSNVNLDLAVKFSPVKHLKGASLELFLMHRFLNQDIENEPEYIINRVNFTQIDITFNYTF
jgi:hypothetical protein